jgi:hypothetical protein
MPNRETPVAIAVVAVGVTLAALIAVLPSSAPAAGSGDRYRVINAPNQAELAELAGQPRGSVGDSDDLRDRSDFEKRSDDDDHASR